ncbi:uncharacterized protein N7484_011329 [Penicillium longicatenatum]|uniref:uncharacterized protein n=1 Tax=Penicillium longicatenatum TaxID=1561947 RepID=UPI0025467DD8|nr:uncharacterized protein N7484_011329 [Penicillium longicatenatum]KAJ5631229.1 hypothetical protein N7484_011329 [Penicillium longicatenatum]
MSTVTATQGPVEARSLSSITAIASNPPAYPRNPTHEKLDPLVLYIVRVPGSQDIFLSPLKPPTKSSVSAEAINASLFYLHVATPEDDALLQEVELEREKETQRRREELEAAGLDDPSQREFARLNHPRRKPVGGAESTADNAPALMQENVTVPGNNAPALPPRRPVAMPQFSAENISFPAMPVANAPLAPSYEPVKAPLEPAGQSPISRRPLPPLPPSEEPFSGHPGDEAQLGTPNRWSAFVGQESGKGRDSWKDKFGAFAAGRHSLDANRPPLPPRSTQPRTASPSRSPGQSPSRQRKAHRPPPIDSNNANNAGFRLTLIRRDPASGTQWNVATISTPHMDHNAIEIEIATPGYNRFAGSDEPLSLASLAANLPAGMVRNSGSSIPVPPSLHVDKPHEQPQQQPSFGPRKFHRQLCVSKPFEDSVSSELKSGYYVFNSPWNGTCTFASSVNGRSLKCKHMIQGPVGTPQPGDDPNPAVTVAELRFNTPFQAANLHYHAAPRTPTNQHSSPTSTYDPSSLENQSSKRASLSQFLNPNTYARPRAHSGPNALSTSTPNTADPQRPPFNPAALLRRTSLRAGRFAQQQSNRFGHQPLHHRSVSASSGDSDEDRLDFSLARELAGGGMRGKSAKLGKLIIEDEGIKMLDLVVSACMAVWWRGYYH